jgi:hypothetical protein
MLKHYNKNLGDQTKLSVTCNSNGMKTIRRYIFLGTLFTLSTFTNAEEIYQYTDNNGNTVISNRATKNAHKLNLPALTYTTTSAVGTNTRNKRNSRTEILKGELEREKQALKNTQALLEQNKGLKVANNDKEQKQALERQKTLEASIIEHKKNIEILTKQLANQ